MSEIFASQVSDLFPLVRGYDLDTQLAKMQVHVEDLLLETNRSLLLSINRFTSSYHNRRYGFSYRQKLCRHLKIENMHSEYVKDTWVGRVCGSVDPGIAISVSSPGLSSGEQPPFHLVLLSLTLTWKTLKWELEK